MDGGAAVFSELQTALIWRQSSGCSTAECSSLDNSSVSRRKVSDASSNLSSVLRMQTVLQALCVEERE